MNVSRKLRLSRKQHETPCSALDLVADLPRPIRTHTPRQTRPARITHTPARMALHKEQLMSANTRENLWIALWAALAIAAIITAYDYSPFA